MNIYPHNSSIILTDDIFVQYGGLTGTSTPIQREAAFLEAEMAMTKYIGTFLLPTIITGTYPYQSNGFISTDYGYVHQILSVNLLSVNNVVTCSLKSDSGCAFIFDDTFGYLHAGCIYSACACGKASPYQYQIAYQAGLPTGTATQPGMLHALSIVAQINLNEMVFPFSNEGVGDVGIEQFSSLDYSEKRKPLKRTALGQSPRANFAARLVDNVVTRAKKAIIFR